MGVIIHAGRNGGFVILGHRWVINTICVDVAIYPCPHIDVFILGPI